MTKAPKKIPDIPDLPDWPDLDEQTLIAAIERVSLALLIVLDREGRIVRFNHGCEIATGYQAFEVIGKAFWEVLRPEEDREETRAEFLRLCRSGARHHEYANFWLAKDGSRKWMVWSNTVICGLDGEVSYVVGTGIDRTQRKHMEDELRKSRERYESLVHSVDGIVWEADALTFQFHYVSPQAERMLGYPVERWLKEPGFWRDHIYEEDRDTAVEFCATATRQLRSHNFEYRMKASDGRILWFRDLVTVIPRDGKPFLVRGIMVDITAEKAAEAEARKQELRFQRFFNSNIVGMLIPSLDGRILEANDASLRLLGYAREDLQSGELRWDSITPPEYREQDERIVAMMREKGSAPPFEKEFFRKDGSRVPVLIGGATLDQELAVAFILDLTERKRLENERIRLLEEAREAVKARNDFIGIASHELRTPLTPLRLQVSAITRLIQKGDFEQIPPEKLQKLCNIAESQLSRLARLIENLLDVSRITAGRLRLTYESVDLAALTREVLDRFQGEIKATGYQVDLRVAASPKGQWDRLRIEQLVTNLVTNAMKYGRGKPIRISIDEQGGLARFQVSDQGIGIDPEAQKVIFDRFERAVSSKQFAGMGLGLFITRQIVQAHQGRIEVDSAPGKGSTFTVTLPKTVQLSVAA